MQIDFHHGTTYVLSRWAGFSPDEAATIAYASQYVDDAVCNGQIKFSNGASYFRRASAHKMIDPQNSDDDANRQSWAIFHFLPGNQGNDKVVTQELSFDEKLICITDSPIAREMVEECIREKKRPYALQRLGITLHVYADTWAHTGFAGVKSVVNRAKLELDSIGDEVKSLLLNVVELGHGTVLTYPDQPALSSWSYENWRGETITQNNTEKFIEASKALFVVLQRYRGIETPVSLSESQQKQLQSYFAGWTSEDGEERHAKWLKGIKNGDFSLPRGEKVSYDADGDHSWKAQALQSKRGWASSDTSYLYTDAFLTSQWKYFHDALDAHAAFVMHELLPQYGICIG